MEVTNNQSVQQQQLVAEQVLKSKLLEQVMQKTLGDGMEFEIVYQAMLDSMSKQGDNSQVAGLFGGLNNSNGQNLQDISALIQNGLNYNSSTSRVTNVNYSGSDADMTKIYNAVNKYSKQYGVDANLVLAVIKTESNFNPTAESGAGAQGLMQLMPSTASGYGISNAFDVDQNVKGGVQLLRNLLNTYGGNTEMALMAYNGGSGNMQRRGVTSASDLYKMPTETQNYVPKVMGYYRNGV